MQRFGLDWRRRHSTMILTWLALAVVVLLQAQPFTYGYRRSADEIEFLRATFGGWSTVEAYSRALAADQGRLGFLAVMPLNILGAYLADGYLARWIFVLLHFGVLAAFAAYFSIISAASVTRPLLVVLTALQTIGGNHDYMPPISYPLQNTLPLLVLLIARCTILLVKPHGSGARYVLWPARIVFLLAIMTTEYAFLFATALLAAEYGFAMGRLWRGGASPVAALLGVIRQRVFLQDVTIVSLALIAYLMYRRLHPSVYVGNVIDAGLEVGQLVETIARHILAGTIFSRGPFDIGSLPGEAVPIVLLVGFLTAACLFCVLDDVRDLPSPVVTASASVLAAAFVTFPLAGNARQQVWCLDNGACGWLDSRISYLAFAVIVICMIALVLRTLPNGRAALTVVAMVSGAIGLVAAMSYARNLHDGLAMAADAKAWERAANLACHPEVQSIDDRSLLRSIDPERLIRFHPTTDKVDFWRGYMESLRAVRPCPADTTSRQAILRQANELRPTVGIGQTIRLMDKSGSAYLGTGWSGRETWGVWSDGERANLHFFPGADPGREALQLHLVFHVYVPPSVGHQKISVTVNGRPVDTWTISADMLGNGCCKRDIALGSDLKSSEEIDITFQIHNPRNPNVDREITDGRHLGLFIQTMTLLAEPPRRMQ
jgi:hypothetical protein